MARLAHDLARRGYRLVLPCRSQEKALALRNAICLHSPRTEFDFVLCDLADLASVSRCAQHIARHHPVIDLMVANAATVEPTLALSAQGVERTFAVNHLAHCTLIWWLLENLYVHSRVLVVASSAAKWARPMFLSDINYSRGDYGMFRAYANSKLANISCAAYFAARLARRQVACSAVHPGLAATSICPTRSLLQKLLVPVLKKSYFASPAQAATLVGRLALEPEYNESCGYFAAGRFVDPPSPAMQGEFVDGLMSLSRDLCAEFLPRWARESG